MKLVSVILVLFIFPLKTLTLELKKPTILVAVLVRNKQHTLPYFLSNLEKLDYPKDRISLWFRSDHNIDQSIGILKYWFKSVKNDYHSIYTEFEDNKSYPGEESIAHWTDERFTHMMNMRDSALNYARKKWADYLLMLDADVFLTNPNTLNYLTSKSFTIVAPMVQSVGLYSNFWHGMTEDYYYLRTEEYKPIVHRENISCYAVPMVHSCVLVDLRRAESDLLTYRSDKIENYDGPHDDIIVFALSAMQNKIPMHICNEDHFGYITVPLEQDDKLSNDFENLLNIKMDKLNTGESLYVNPRLAKYTSLPEKDSMMFDKIYMINLKRRPDRRKRMHKCFDELGLEVETVDAVDGKLLNETFLQSLQFMPDFQDPYHKRPMKLGEIGCFLSHLEVWQEIVKNNYHTTLVLEDDVKFESFFRTRVENVMSEVLKISDWDLVYFGRKRLQEKEEPWIANYLVQAGYSYWTLGYTLSLKGAKKLLDAQPLTKLVPVDEYLPILFDKHPHENWKGYYPKRDLVALSAAPLLIYPTHYTGDKGYISDTEDSVVIPEEVLVKEDL
ncbi:unnamed protein product [Ceutorhynchus assimilis]|uniref:Glycosyl transferase family 25 domain-containing protein n=1 Tax=Ceutorhynchus assimilis TaxID=467358 RepID=A0A9N9QQV1_9CUCU|nr:unnamed protein product [Ceutorhynchus assimilis]